MQLKPSPATLNFKFKKFTPLFVSPIAAEKSKISQTQGTAYMEPHPVILVLYVMFTLVSDLQKC